MIRSRGLLRAAGIASDTDILGVETQGSGNCSSGERVPWNLIRVMPA